MAYNENIPQPSDRLSQSQADLLANFQAIKTLVDINHVDFADAVNQGKHKVVTFPVQSPVPTFAGGETGLYNFLSPATAKNETYVHTQTGATTREVPMTASILSGNSAPASDSGGWTYYPSGIFETWGSGNGNGLTTVTLTFAPANQILGVMVCPKSAGTVYQNLQVRLIDVLSRTQFRIFVSVNGVAAAGGFSFFVKGY